MQKRILVPVDGSGLVECVPEHVKAIATACNVLEVDFLFVNSRGSTPSRASISGPNWRINQWM